jgi:hypothetical protein
MSGFETASTVILLVLGAVVTSLFFLFVATVGAFFISDTFILKKILVKTNEMFAKGIFSAGRITTPLVFGFTRTMRSTVDSTLSNSLIGGLAHFLGARYGTWGADPRAPFYAAGNCFLKRLQADGIAASVTPEPIEEY